MNRIRVNLSSRTADSHEIIIGAHILDRVAFIISRSGWGNRYVIITDENVLEIHGSTVLDHFRAVGIQCDVLTIPQGECSKTMLTCLKLAEQLADLEADRKTALVALGGGVVGDITGFLASIYMRGVSYIQIPTTLMAQVDSAIGGKTGVNDETGKNILGTFYQPTAVFIDVSLLKTLPDCEFQNGIAEIVKYGIIEDPSLLDLLEENFTELRRNESILVETVARCCKIKKGIVEIDEKELSIRRVLNFGHTVGHAIEVESQFSISHGRAVSIGMWVATCLSEALGYLSSESRIRVGEIFGKLNLPMQIPSYISVEGLMEKVKRDKKKEGEKINFVLLKKLGMPFINGGVPMETLRQVIEGNMS
ncbi:MAG: 3-dehydroquinate synthase [Syntrophales bacterium]|nr:3-dehydroquinate synthase [Syntrophales bacterium]